MKLQAINSKKKLTIHNTVEWILGMDADNVSVEVLNCEVKKEPNDCEGNILHFIISIVPINNIISRIQFSSTVVQMLFKP